MKRKPTWCNWDLMKLDQGGKQVSTPSNTPDVQADLWREERGEEAEAEGEEWVEKEEEEKEKNLEMIIQMLQLQQHLQE